MDIDDTAALVVHNVHNALNTPPRPAYPLHPTNALAGPSTPPSLFLPPQDPPRPTPPFRSTDDLLSRFQLLSAYDRYVRPYTTPSGALASSSTSADKGKGKEREFPSQHPATPSAPGAMNEGEEEDNAGKGEKKWKNNYRHLIKGIPGKHSMKKDDYLMNMIQVPPKQRINITPFDLRTQREAFSVSLEGLKGWNVNVLVAESPQAREDRKRRKEMKRLAKAQQMAGLAPNAAPHIAAPVPLAAGASAPAAAARTGTPRPASGAAGRPPAQNGSQPRGATPAGVGTPRSVSTPGMSTASNATSAPAPVVAASASAPAQLSASVPAATHVPTPVAGAVGDVKRGVKRERDESVGGAGMRPATGNGNVPPPGKPYMVTAGAKAGMNGIRPRPVKKQRVDGGHVPVQQPTPHA